MCSAPDRQIDLVQRAYRIGGLTLTIQAPPFHESGNLAAFRTECRREGALRLTVRTDPALCVPPGAQLPEVGEAVYFDAEGQKIWYCCRDRERKLLYLRSEPRPGEILVRLDEASAEKLGTNLILRWLDLPDAFLRRDGLLLHASMIRVHKRAILFTAAKQTGKSTQAELWRTYRRAEILNGDRALIRRVEDGWYAFGTPYNGTSGICRNAQQRLGAVVILRQGSHNEARRASAPEAVAALVAGSAYRLNDRRAAELVLDLAVLISEAVPIFVLTCKPEEAAVACLERALQKEGLYDE